jgi:sulfur-oxidizing protein SoxB
MIKVVLEDVADNLFNPDPYYQQGGDMVRVGGLEYTINPAADAGNRISDMRLNGQLIEASKDYKVAGWAPVSEAARDQGGEPIWDVVAAYLRDKKTVKAVAPNMPKIIGAEGNPGFAPLS